MSQTNFSGTTPCPRCGYSVAIGKRFCTQCGGAIAPPPAPSPAAAPEKTASPPPMPTGAPPPMPRQPPAMPPQQIYVPPTYPPQTYNPAPPQIPAGQEVAAVGRSHWPILAVLSGVVLPGAGQAYNGKVLRAFFIALIGIALLAWAATYGTILNLPLILAIGWQVLMALLAWLAARGIVQRGGRMAKGGLLWVFLQFWLVANLTLAVLIGLTLKGVLQ